MSGHLYVLRGDRGEDPEDFCLRIMDHAAPEVMSLGEFDLTVTLTELRPPLICIIPFSTDPVALFSLGGEKLPRTRCAQALRKHGSAVYGYVVSTTVPRGYERTWPVGERTPGVGMLTLFRRRRGLDDETFIDRWHGSHTPLTLEIHPVWNYVRNVVESPIVEGSPTLDGIVQEHFRTASDLLNPVRFFGGALRMSMNMARVGWDISRFIDLNSLETYLVSEFVLRVSRHGP